MLNPGKAAQNEEIDVFGTTPFEHDLTAEPASVCATVSRPVGTVSSWRSTIGYVQICPVLPSWMKGAAGSGR
jgi:hypothetical protein